MVTLADLKGKALKATAFFALALALSCAAFAASPAYADESLGAAESNYFDATADEDLQSQAATVYVKQTAGAMALKSDGTLWSWDAHSATSAPVQLTSLTDVESIVEDSGEYLAIKKDGTVWQWSQNGGTQPVQVLSNAKEVKFTSMALGAAAITNNGDLYTWDPQVTNPAPIKVLTKATSMAAGWNSWAAVRSDGSVWAWPNEAPELKAQVLTGVSKVAVCPSAIAVIKTDGTLWVYDSNTDKSSGESVASIQVSNGRKLFDKIIDMALSETNESYVLALNSKGELLKYDFDETKSSTIASNVWKFASTGVSSGYSGIAYLTTDGDFYLDAGDFYSILDESGMFHKNSEPVKVKSYVGDFSIGQTGSVVVLETFDGAVWSLAAKHNKGTDVDRMVFDSAGELYMHRLYNPNSGEHFYTVDTAEKNHLVKLGWKYEKKGWSGAAAGRPVYRMYNKAGGEHHYTLDAAERDHLVSVGWNYEGIGWKSGGATELHREYNPNAFANNHNYTPNVQEHKKLIKLGWKDEGIGWYGL